MKQSPVKPHDKIVPQHEGKDPHHEHPIVDNRAPPQRFTDHLYSHASSPSNINCNCTTRNTGPGSFIHKHADADQVGNKLFSLDGFTSSFNGPAIPRHSGLSYPSLRHELYLFNETFISPSTQHKKNPPRGRVNLNTNEVIDLGLEQAFDFA
jgi:hypothetical protein